MAEYKTVRLELRVYEELRKRMLPMESMSQVIERILQERDELSGHAQAIIEITKGVRYDLTKSY